MLIGFRYGKRQRRTQLPAPGNDSVVASPGSVMADGTSSTTITVAVVDANGNPVTGTTVTLSASGTGNLFGSISGTTDTRGIFSTTLASTVAQTETITATEGKVQEFTTVTFTGPPSSQQSTIVSKFGTVAADGSSSTTLTVTIEDANGNVIPSEAVSLSSTGSDDVFGATSGITDANGVFTTTLASTKAQAYDTITATEGSVRETTTVAFTAGSPSASMSSIMASPSSVAANGTATTKLTVRVEDANGNLVTGAAVSLSSTGTGDVFGGTSGVTDARGVFTTTLASITAQASDTITATEGGVRETTTVAFTASVSQTVAAGQTLALNNSTQTGDTIDNLGAVDVLGTVSADDVTITNETTTSGTAGTLELDGSGYTSLPFVRSTAATVNLTTTHANDVIVVDVIENATTVAAVSDGAGLTWYLRAVAGSASQPVYEYYAIAPTALTNDNIQVSFAGTASYVDLNAFGVSGVETSAPFDTNPSVPATHGTGPASVSTNNANDLILASYRFLYDQFPAAGLGWSAINPTGGYYLSEYQITSSAQSALVANASTSDQNGGIVDAFVQASSTSSSATMTVSAGSSLDLEGSTISGGTLTNFGTTRITGSGQTTTLDDVNLVNRGVASGSSPALAIDGNGFTNLPFEPSTAASVSLTTSNANDVIIVDIVENSTTVTSVTDTAGLVWHQRAVAGTSLHPIYEYYAIAPSALTNDQIAVSFAGTASYADVNAFGISGANTASPFDPNVAVPSTPASSKGSVSTSDTNDLIFAGYRFTEDETPSAGTGWTAINAGGGYYLSEYQVVSSAQSGLLALASSSDQNGGIIDAVVQAPAPTGAATVAVDAGSSLDLNGAIITGGTLNNGGTVEVIGDAISTLDGVAVSNGGATIIVDAGATLALEASSIAGGTAHNLGTVDVTGPGASLLDGVTLTNTSANIVVDAGATLDLNNAAINGGGLSNAGTVDATGATTLNGVAVTSSGLLEATAGTLTLDPTSMTNTGTLLATGGATLDLESISVTNGAGKIKVDSGSTLKLDQTSITGGTLANSGIVDMTGNATLDGVAVSNGTVGVAPLTLDGDGFTNRPFEVTTSATVSLTTTKSNDVLVLDVVQNGPAVTAVTDSAGLGWHLRAQAGAGSATIEEYYAIASNAVANDTITVNFAGAASYVDFNAFGVNGANTASPFDPNASVAATGKSGPASITTTDTNDVILASYRFSGNASPAAGTGFTSVNASGGYFLSEYDIVSAAQNGLVVTASTADQNGGIIDAIVQASATSATMKIESGTTTTLGATTITGGALNNYGSVFVTGGTTSTLDGVVATDTGGSFTIDAASTLQLNNSGVTGGSIDDNNSNSTLDLKGNDTLAGLSVQNAGGTISVEAASKVSLRGATIQSGSLTNAGTLDVSGTTASTLDGVTMTNSTAVIPAVPLALDGNGFTSLPFQSSTAATVQLTTSRANDLIIVDVVQNGTTVASVADGAGLVWQQRAVAGSSGETIEEYYALAPTALTADSITVKFAGTASYADVNAFGVSGANTASPFDTGAPATGGAGPASISTANATDMIVASSRFAADATPSAGANWTAISASGGYYLSEYQLVSATEQNLKATASTADQNGSIIDAIQQAGPTTTAAVTTVDAGSTLNLNASSITGGRLTNAGTVNSTGTTLLDGVAVTNSGLMEATTGTLTVNGAVSNSGNLFASGANLDVTGAVTGSGTAEIGGNNAVLEFGGAFGQTTTFDPGAIGQLKLDNAQTFNGTVAGLASVDSIDLANFQFSNTPLISQVTGTGAAGTTTNITIEDGALTATVALLNQYTNQFVADAGAYSLTSDNPGHANAGTLFQLAVTHS